ncbi:putative quinol monooxygenase [Sphingomonas glacialis]|uniref:Antibiotic biosynthesis monooxygenase n=1 Tax=Sphingomonas glacialis TaxID=658225 RepID=A0A502FTQ5_9SPHN|nr:putative quinol monooxygenase [Sphingomonas glacialis]TPG52642.1 antibiotic biosynthesis monooxygenase [Sphingomonas glacialis]
MDDVPAMIIYAIYRVHSDDVDAFASVAVRMATEATSHDGCLFLDVVQDVGDPTTFRLVESWRDQAALDKHLANPAFHDALREARKLRIETYRSDVYLVSDRVPTAMPTV